MKNNRIVSVTFSRTEQTETGQWVQDFEQLTTIKADFLISAFGSGLEDQDGKALFKNFCKALIGFFK